jgi:hypothetical protein
VLSISDSTSQTASASYAKKNKSLRKDRWTPQNFNSVLPVAKCLFSGIGIPKSKNAQIRNANRVPQRKVIKFMRDKRREKNIPVPWVMG